MASLPPAKANSSSFARVSLFCYLLLIIYASWYPFTGWQNRGLSPLDLLVAPLPHYWTLFDALTNVLAYLPFGMLVVFALYPKLRRWPAGLLAIFAGIALSALMESGQTILPSRIASNLDLLTNSLGTCVGAGIGLLMSHAFLEQSRLLTLRQRWFNTDAGRGLIVLALWPIAQIYPQGYLFGQGQITTKLSEILSDWFVTPIDIGALLRGGAQLNAEQYWLSETIVTACGLTGTVLMLLFLMRRQASRRALILFLVGTTLALKTLAI
ncbi:MAG: VanZ family protein, partial [Herbaspirillum sp.]